MCRILPYLNQGLWWLLCAVLLSSHKAMELLCSYGLCSWIIFSGTLARNICVMLLTVSILTKPHGHFSWFHDLPIFGPSLWVDEWVAGNCSVTNWWCFTLQAATIYSSRLRSFSRWFITFMSVWVAQIRVLGLVFRTCLNVENFQTKVVITLRLSKAQKGDKEISRQFNSCMCVLTIDLESRWVTKLVLCRNNNKVQAQFLQLHFLTTTFLFAQLQHTDSFGYMCCVILLSAGQYSCEEENFTTGKEMMCCIILFIKTHCIGMPMSSIVPCSCHITNLLLRNYVSYVAKAKLLTVLGMQRNFSNVANATTVVSTSDTLLNVKLYEKLSICSGHMHGGCHPV